MATPCPVNVIFISGMHGTGKSTLVKRIKEERPNVIVYNKCEMTEFTDCFERQVRRLAKYRIDYERVCKLANENRSSVVITDRCIYDAMMYIETFRKINKLNESEYSELMNTLEALFPTDSLIYPVNVFLMNPGKEEISKHLQKRQQELVKWNETDHLYNEICYETYEKRFIEVCKPISVLESSSLEENAAIVIKYIDALDTGMKSVGFHSL